MLIICVILSILILLLTHFALNSVLTEAMNIVGGLHTNIAYFLIIFFILLTMFSLIFSWIKIKKKKMSVAFYTLVTTVLIYLLFAIFLDHIMCYFYDLLPTSPLPNYDWN